MDLVFGRPELGFTTVLFPFSFGLMFQFRFVFLFLYMVAIEVVGQRKKFKYEFC